MPSLGDVANDIKAILEDVRSNTIVIKNNTASIKANTATIIAGLAQLDTDLKNGFTNLAQGLKVLILLGIQENQLLSDNNKQNEEIICWLTNIANTICDIKHNTDKEIVLQTDLSKTLHHIDDINELVNAPQAMEVANHYKIEKKLNECCPPKKDLVLPCFEKCATFVPSKIEPVKPDWNPINYGGQNNIG